MKDRHVSAPARIVSLLVGLVFCLPVCAQTPKAPDKVYVPYKELRRVFESEKQGVFLPYADFRRLWVAAQGEPAAPTVAPVPYLISTARFTGSVGADLATMELTLTVDILADGWVEVPLSLGQAAVAKVSFLDGDAERPPLLRVIDGKYVLLARDKGRRALRVEFVRQLVTRPGLNILKLATPPAAITTLELLIPEENMKVDVKPLLAATTTQVTADGKKATKLQAFLGSGGSVELSWKPKAQAAEALPAVVISEQLQHIHVDEALINYDATFTFDVRRRGVGSFTIELPPSFRVTSVEGDNIRKWDISAPEGAAPGPQVLRADLFTPVKGKYVLTIRMERFLKDPEVEVPLTPIITRGVLRRTGVIAITHSPRRSVELRDPKDLARVHAGRLPPALRKRAGVTAYRFITGDYGGRLAIGTVAPRVKAAQFWALGVFDDRTELLGRLTYDIDRAGIFEVRMDLPEPWSVTSVGPPAIVDEYELTGQGANRRIRILLKKEVTGKLVLDLAARAPRTSPDAALDFLVPLPDPKDLRTYSGRVLLQLTDQLRTEVEKLDQLHPISITRLRAPVKVAKLAPAMAFEFKAVDRDSRLGARFKIAVKPPQVSAVVHRLVNVQPGSIEQEAVIRYRILYAPVDTFYVKLPAALADAGVQISGKDIKEKPRIKELPPDQRKPGEPATGPATRPTETAPAGEEAPDKWAYYKVVLQSPVKGSYTLKVNLRRSFKPGAAGVVSVVKVEPILAAGALADQSGTIAVAKADTLAIGAPTVQENLEGADPGSSADLPYAPHRRLASLAFKYSAPPFALSLPVMLQKEAPVFTTIARSAVVEQVIGRDGTLSGHVTYLLVTSKGDRLAITLPPAAKLYAVMINGSEAPVEAAPSLDQRIVRLPPSAGQLARVVLEISYGQDKADPGALTVPALPEDIPVQQTIWRLWVPDETHLLWFDRTFALLPSGRAKSALGGLSQDQPTAVSFKLTPQGRAWDFVRQGAPGSLGVRLADKEWFAVILWAAIVVAGAGMLKLRGWFRCLIVLALVLVGAVVGLFAPLLVRRILATGAWAGALVLALWLGHYLFASLPKRSKRLTVPAPPPQPPAPDKPEDQPKPEGEQRPAGPADPSQDKE